MIIHFQILRSFSLPRRLSTCSGLCCQALNGNLGWLEESQLQRRLREKKNRGENKDGCLLRRIRASTRGIKYCVSENGKAFETLTTPRLYALQRERRDVALMQLLEHDSVFSESVNLLNSELEHSLTEEMPVLFHIETSMVQSLIPNVSNLKDAILIKELIEGKAKELMMRVHVNSVLGSAVPSSTNCDDIIIRTGHLKHSDNTTEKVSLWHDFVDKERLRCTDIGLRSRYIDDQVKGMAKTENLHASTGGRILMCSGTTSSSKNKDQQTCGRPDREQLELMFHRLSEEMPHFFEQSHDYGMYSQDLEFDNRIMRVKTKGLAAYKATVQSLKLASTAYLVNAHLDLLRLTMQPENGTILARWRLKGVPLHSYVLRPLAKKHRYRYFDAFSMFQVGSDGLIHHHRLDKIIPDSEKIKEVSMVTKIGIALGLVRPPAISTNWMTGDPPQV